MAHFTFGTGRSTMLGGSSHVGWPFRLTGTGRFDVLGKTASLPSAADSRAAGGFLRKRWNGSH